MKYMSLFTNGNSRVVDDERGQKRRKGVWNRIREGLLEELKKEGGRENENEDGGSDSSSSSSCPSSDSEDEDNDVTYGGKKKLQLSNAKNWVNLDAAKKALLSMPMDTYPNAPSLMQPTTVTTNQRSGGNVSKRSAKVKDEQKAAEKSGDKVETAVTSDNRFVLSKDQDELFKESTTGDDYQKELQKDGSSSSSSSDSDYNLDASSSDDDADPLKNVKAKSAAKGGEEKTNKEKAKNAAASSSSSSPSSSSSSSSDSDSDDDEPVNAKAGNNLNNTKRVAEEEENRNNDDDDDEEDDFFTTEKVSTEDAFAQAQKEQQKNRHRHNNEDYMHFQKKSDKSKGFASQNQSKREFRNFQHRQKRSKFG